MKKLNILFLLLISLVLFIPNAFGDFMVPLDKTIESWGKPVNISNDRHRYLFKNQFGDLGVVYLDNHGKVIIDSLLLGPGRFGESYKMKKLLNSTSEGYRWHQIYFSKSVGEAQVSPIPNHRTYLSSHKKYIALMNENRQGKCNKILVFDIKLFNLFVKRGYDPFTLYENDVVNEYLNSSNDLIVNKNSKVNTEAKSHFDKKDYSFEPLVEMDGNIFPSYIIATSQIDDLNKYSNSGKYRGEKNGIIGVRFYNNKPNNNVRVEIRGTNYIKESTWRGILENSDENYEIFPTIEYDFQLLYKNKQPVLETITFAIYSENELRFETKKRIVIRPINECPYFDKTRHGKDKNLNFLFAAYVNEDHPIIDQFLGFAKTLGLENRFIGYQGNQQKVLQQVYTIWYALQRKGITYSSITDTSLGSDKVFSQNVRFIEESIYNSQANCVDGSVLLASIIKRIGIDPFLILVPGHCYLGFFGSPGKKNPLYLETTMIGNVELKKAWLNLQSRREVSRKNFNHALQSGYKNFQQHFSSLKNHKKGYHLIDIDDARKAGVMVLKSNV